MYPQGHFVASPVSSTHTNYNHSQQSRALYRYDLIEHQASISILIIHPLQLLHQLCHGATSSKKTRTILPSHRAFPPRLQVTRGQATKKRRKGLLFTFLSLSCLRGGSILAVLSQQAQAAHKVNKQQHVEKNTLLPDAVSKQEGR